MSKSHTGGGAGAEISYGENLQVARGCHREENPMSHTPPPCHLKTGKMADKTRDVSSRNGVARLRHRQRKARPGIHSSTHLAEGIIPESARIRPFRGHPGSTPGEPAAPSSALEPVHATGTPTSRPPIPPGTRSLGRTAAPRTGRRRDQPRGTAPHTDPTQHARLKRAPAPRVPFYSARRPSVPPTAPARPRPRRPSGSAPRQPTLEPLLGTTL